MEDNKDILNDFIYRLTTSQVDMSPEITEYMDIKENKNYLNFKYKDYIFTVPNNTMEIVKEGSSLNHCIGSYIDRILDNDAFIIFMRKDKEKDKSLITLNVLNNKILSAKGQSNRNPNRFELTIIEEYQKYLDTQEVLK